MGELHRRAGTLADGQFTVVLSASEAGWSYSALRVLNLDAGGSALLETGPEEMLVLPLSGSCKVRCDDLQFELTGRSDVFSEVTDFAYVPRDAHVEISSWLGGRFALPSAVARRRLAPRYCSASAVPIELRGAGACSRQVNNFCSAEAFEADRLIACEVLTPAGNWSSYPPHKHDSDGPAENVLEEIYYFEVAPGPAGPGFAYQRVYGTAERPLELLAEVRSGDVVLVPHGWHGPSMAAPGYDLYYLNVMAGPGAQRSWLVCHDPSHAWVRDGWQGQSVDPRLPMTRGGQS